MTHALFDQLSPSDWPDKLSSDSSESDLAPGTDAVVLQYNNSTNGTAFIVNASVVPFDENSVTADGWVNFYAEDNFSQVISREYANVGRGNRTAKMSDSVPMPIESGGSLTIRCYNLDSTDDFYFHASYTVLEPHAEP